MQSTILMVFLAVCCCCCCLAEPSKYHGNSQEIVFDGPISSRSSRTSPANNQLLKSIEFAKQMSRIQSDEEFFKLLNVVPAELSYGTIALADRFGGAERSSAIRPKPATCMPELQVVPVKEDPDPAAIYFPNCVRINRCGGCCNHALLSCQPTATEIRNYQIHVSKIDEELEQPNVFKEIVALEEHTACKCNCIVKEQDCTDKQYYIKDECRCVCKNTDEENKCRQQSDKKYWNVENCSCQCRKVEECATGFYFDQNLCSCKNLPISRHWYADEKRTGYNTRPQQQQQPGKSRDSQPVIITLDATDPRRKHKEDPEYK